uniref:Uncharacterized protein n=1 Tax=Solanum lycopersicum TaxID=4081 RepID=A0A3Q7G5J9_SOLLC
MVVEFQNNSSWTFEQEEIVTAGDTTIVIESLSIPLFSSLTSSFFSILRPSFDTESFEDEPPNLKFQAFVDFGVKEDFDGLSSYVMHHGGENFVDIIWPGNTTSIPQGWVIPALPYYVPYEYVPFVAPDGKSAADYKELVHQAFLR